MAMRVISEKTLRDFWDYHPNARQPLQAWVEDAKRADWNSPADIKAIHKNVSIIADNRVVFNIKENDYRLVAKFTIMASGSIFALLAHMHSMIKLTQKLFKRRKTW